MFKIGEKVVCINSIESTKPNIKNGSTYTVKYYVYRKPSFFITINGEYREEQFFASRFISIKEERRKKLNKLNGK
jgi:hypothetical protein